jgi:hypothetical protein
VSSEEAMMKDGIIAAEQIEGSWRKNYVRIKYIRSGSMLDVQKGEWHAQTVFG